MREKWKLIGRSAQVPFDLTGRWGPCYMWKKEGSNSVYYCAVSIFWTEGVK